MPYYGMTDPGEFYQGSNFDPFTGRLQGGQIIQQILAQIAGNKRKKKEEEWELEDREMGKRYKEAQIRNLDEVAQPKVPAQKGYVLPPTVRKKVAQFHGFTNESEYDEYDPQFQEDMFQEYAESEKMARARGLKISPNKSGMSKLKMIDTALAQINKRSSEVAAEYRALIMQPMSDQTGEGKALARRTVENLNRLRMKFATYPWKMDESGNLPEPYEQELQSYLLSPDAVETGRAFERPQQSQAKTEAPPRAGKFKGEVATSPSGKSFIWDGTKWVKK